MAPQFLLRYRRTRTTSSPNKGMITLPKIPELDRQRYLADLEMQTVASKLAFEFNKRLVKLRFGKINLGGLGITKFFANPKCNSFCGALGLKMLPNDD